MKLQQVERCNEILEPITRSQANRKLLPYSPFYMPIFFRIEALIDLSLEDSFGGQPQRIIPIELYK